MGLFTNIFIEYHTVLLAGVGLLVHELVVYSSWVNISMFQHQEFEASMPKKSQANPYRWISNLRQILGSLQWPGFRVVSVLFPTKTVSCMSLWDLKRPRSEWIDTLHSTYPNTWKIDGFGTWSTFISRLFLAQLPQILDAKFPVRCHSSWTCWRTSFQRRFSDIFQGSPTGNHRFPHEKIWGFPVN